MAPGRGRPGGPARLAARLGGWALAGLAACAAGPPAPPAVAPTAPAFGPAELERLSQGLGESLSAMLQQDSPALTAVVMLPLARLLELAAEGADASDVLAAHQLFLLSDGIEAAAPARSVLRAYQAVVRSAHCLPWDGPAPVGCRLLEEARQLFDGTPERAPPYARPDFPSWKGVVATPQAWAAAEASWADVDLGLAGQRLTMQSLFVTLQRPWLSDEFLRADGWYLAGACRGAVSAGWHAGGEARRALLPQLPVGMLLARNFSLEARREGAPVPLLAWQAPRLIAWVYRRLPTVPLHSDPCRADCADAAAGAAGCAAPADLP